jgi:hypothetical protein
MKNKHFHQILLIAVGFIVGLPSLGFAGQTVVCAFKSIDEHGTVVQQQSTSEFSTGQTSACTAKWDPSGVTFCNTHSSPAGYQILWGSTFLVQKPCLALGQAQTYQCNIEETDVIQRVIYQNVLQTATETECVNAWNTARTNACISDAGATLRTYFNSKLVHTQTCPLPNYPCTLQFADAANQPLFQNTTQKPTQSDCIAAWTDTWTSKCAQLPGSKTTITLNGQVIQTKTCPAAQPTRARYR